MPKNEIREQLVLRNFKWNAPKYYDYPDGQDLLGKLSFTTKMGFFTGALFGMFMVERSLILTTPRIALLKALLWVAPCVGAPIAFTTVTYAATNLRKKDDQVNYVLGGIAAAVVGANLARKPQYSAILALMFSALGIMKKTCEMNGTKMFPPLPGKRFDPPYIGRAWNFSLVKDREPNWTREPTNAKN